jgi:arylsulfatase A-like enzyme
MKLHHSFYLLLILGVIVLISGVDPEKSDLKSPNILFIEVDDLTAKYLGMNGAGFAETPHIDRLADEGVYFENAVCQGAMCGPSRNSLITALYPHNLGFYENKQIKSLPKDVWTFPKALQQTGYETFWVGKCHIKPNLSGIKGKNRTDRKNLAMKVQMGFDHVFQSAGRVVALRTAKKAIKKGQWTYGLDAYADSLYEKGLIDQFLSENGEKATNLDGDREYMDGFFTSMTIDQLSEYEGEKPFFMWTNFSCPHGPFDVPQNYHDMVNADDMPDPIRAESETFEIPAALKPKKNKMDPDETLSYRAAYMASIQYVDHQVGRLMKYIQNSRYADNTLVVFFSDHGIMTGDHGLLHKSTLFKEVLDPSLIIWYPKQFTAKRIKAPVELLDLGKTVMDMAGASEAFKANCPNGYSLLPLLAGEGSFDHPGVVFSEIEGFRSVFDGRYKYIDNAEMPILFDLQQNPDETINYSDENPEIVALLKQKHDDWIQRSGSILPAGGEEGEDED